MNRVKRTLHPHNPLIPSTLMLTMSTERRSSSVNDNRAPVPVYIVHRSCQRLGSNVDVDDDNSGFAGGLSETLGRAQRDHFIGASYDFGPSQGILGVVLSSLTLEVCQESRVVRAPVDKGVRYPCIYEGLEKDGGCCVR